MKVIQKDILSIEKGIICQQVNCKGIMNAGLAKTIKEKWPIVEQEYKNTFAAAKEQNINLLGKMLKVNTKMNYLNVPQIIVANLFAQEDYGNEPKLYTDYNALRESLNKAFILSKETMLQLYIPFGLGCGLANGDWSIVTDIILNLELLNNIETIVCKI